MDPAELGIPSEAGDDGEGLWPGNEAAWSAFAAVATQWRVAAGMSGATIIGLDYAGVQAGLALEGIVVTPALWADLRMIERGAVEGMNGRRDG